MLCWNFPNAMRHATCDGPNLSDKRWVESTFESTRELHHAMWANFDPCPTDILFQHVSFMVRYLPYVEEFRKDQLCHLGEVTWQAENWRYSALADPYGYGTPNKVVYLDYAGAALFSRAQLAATQARFWWDFIVIFKVDWNYGPFFDGWNMLQY